MFYIDGGLIAFSSKGDYCIILEGFPMVSLDCTSSSRLEAN